MIMWIQGGPGASGFIGNFFEVGPLDLINSTTLVSRLLIISTTINHFDYY